jgi:thiosulfate/3-mercaptopyruvate sulfurtransferase
LERIGHPRVSVLEGGLVRWVLDGRKVVNAVSRPPRAVYALEAGGRANEADLDAVREARDQRSALLLDVRSKEEYRGDRKDPRSGHIPGARWWVWDQAVALDKGFQLRDEMELRRSLKGAGVTNPKQALIAYCQSGHRATQTYLALRSLGFENVRVYANSMNEYGLLKTEPVKQGK